MMLAGAGGRPLNCLPTKNIKNKTGQAKAPFFYGEGGKMNELEKFLPMPPQFGPPLPSSFKVIWPWLKRPPQKEYVLPMAEDPELVTAPAAEPEPAPVPAATKAVNYEVETPPEILSAGTPHQNIAWLD